MTVGRVNMKEVRFHGRGGQGAVTSAELIAHAAIGDGCFAQSFPSFGPERRGAPVVAFVRINDTKIRTRAEIARPDIIVLLDSSLIKVVDVCAGLKEDGFAILNSRHKPADIDTPFPLRGRIATVDANTIAREVLGVPITNTTMVGALIKATGIVKFDCIKKPLEERFGRIAEKNFNAMKRAYDETIIWE